MTTLEFVLLMLALFVGAVVLVVVASAVLEHACERDNDDPLV